MASKGHAGWREKIGQAIRARRVQLGYLSVRSLEAQSGVSEGTWRTLERGWRIEDGVRKAPNPGFATIVGVAEALGWEHDWLERLQRDEEPTLVRPPLSVVPDDAATQLLAEVRELRRLVEELRPGSDDASVLVAEIADLKGQVDVLQRQVDRLKRP